MTICQRHYNEQQFRRRLMDAGDWLGAKCSKLVLEYVDIKNQSKRRHFPSYAIITSMDVGACERYPSSYILANDASLVKSNFYKALVNSSLFCWVL